MERKIFALHHEDDIIYLHGETIQEIQEKAENEIRARTWHTENCWSEEIL